MGPLIFGILVTTYLGFKARVTLFVLGRVYVLYILVKFISDVTPADLLEAHMVVEPFSSKYEILQCCWRWIIVVVYCDAFLEGGVKAAVSHIMSRGRLRQSQKLSRLTSNYFFESSRVFKEPLKSHSLLCLLETRFIYLI